MSEVSRLIEPPEFKQESEYEVSLVLPPYVDSVWAKARVILEPAIDRSYGRWSSHALRMACLAGQQQLWVVFDEDSEVGGATTTEFVDYPSRRVLAVQFLGGKDLDEWAMIAIGRFESWASQHGADGLEAVGREGFWKLLSEDGWKKSFQVFEKRLT